jgi:hypothetical protein
MSTQVLFVQVESIDHSLRSFCSRNVIVRLIMCQRAVLIEMSLVIVVVVVVVMPVLAISTRLMMMIISQTSVPYHF